MQAHGELEAAICAVLDRKGLQKPASCVHKIVQLHETLAVRFGAMLVGPAGSGKSTLLQTLKVCLTGWQASSVTICCMNLLSHLQHVCVALVSHVTSLYSLRSQSTHDNC